MKIIIEFFSKKYIISYIILYSIQQIILYIFENFDFFYKLKTISTVVFILNKKNYILFSTFNIIYFFSQIS